jgi:hypothetical protein
MSTRFPRVRPGKFGFSYAKRLLPKNISADMLKAKAICLLLADFVAKGLFGVTNENFESR